MSKRIVYYQSTWNGYELTFAYDERVVSMIKSRVKAVNRTYDSRSRAWVIHRKADFDNLRWATNGWIDWQRT